MAALPSRHVPLLRGGSPHWEPGLSLGLRANAAQFSLLVVINAFVGAMVGLERTVLPILAEREFALAARAAVLSFIVVFGVTKALSNYAAGRLSDRFGRKRVLVAGWALAIPVPFMLMWAPTWDWVLYANALLGVSQGLTWSTTVVMKIDLVGRHQRGLAMGLNEGAGYMAMAASALATGWIAAAFAITPQPFYLGVGYVAVGLALSCCLARDTRAHAALDIVPSARRTAPSGLEIFRRATFADRHLSAATQTGLVNNLNDGLAWGLFPLVYWAAGLDLARIGVLASIYPATWGFAQLFTGAASDRIGRKPLIVWGMVVQAAAIAMVALSSGFSGFAVAAAGLGLGTAMVYPTLLASISDVADAAWRASAIGVYRLWRDLGYAIGALLAGLIADLLGVTWAVGVTAAITLASGVIAAVRLRETVHPAAKLGPGPEN